MPSAETGVVGRRCGQWLIDRLIAFVPAFALLIVVFFAVLPDRSLWFLPGPLFLLGLLLGNLATDVWMPHRTGGRTPGMRLLGLRIVTEWGGTPSSARTCCVSCLQTVDGFAFGLAGLLVMAFSPRHQRVGDMVARTLVVRSAPSGRDHPGDSPRQQADRAHEQERL